MSTLLSMNTDDNVNLPTSTTEAITTIAMQSVNLLLSTINED